MDDPNAKPGGPPTAPAPLIGQDIAAGDINDPERFRPLTDAEMEAELDAIEAQELATRDSAPTPAAPTATQAWLQQANLRRAEGNLGAARHLLYRVLEDGNADERRVARNILSDLDS
jgi:sec-independent protein translocase protein TatC